MNKPPVIQAQTTLRSPFPPITCVAESRLLPVQATLEALPLHHFIGHRSHLVEDVAPLFEEFPHCPGILIFDQRQFEGVVSRSQLLEWLLNPSLNGFTQPLAILMRMARSQPIVLPATTPIQIAAEQILRQQWGNHHQRVSSLQQSDPVVVQFDESTYRLLDVHILLQSAWQIKDMTNRIQIEKMQVQMIQTEKMASLGRLVNGVAHEILDPVGFVWGNLCHISDYTHDILNLLHHYEASLTPLPSDLLRLREEVELDYLEQDLPKAIASIQSGADRIKKLASSLQTFCYIDEVYPKPADINNCLDSILFLLETRLSGEIKLVRCYNYLPPVTCYIGQLSYVFTNILTKAVNTLMNQIGCNQPSQNPPEFQDKSSFPSNSDPQPQITVTTQVWTQHFDDSNPDPQVLSPLEKTTAQSPPTVQILNGQQGVALLHDYHRWVSITIVDNGPPLSSQDQQQLQTLLSSHQPMDEETSLALSYQIVSEKHDGKLLVRSPLDNKNNVDANLDMTDPTHYETDADQDSALPARGTAFQILLPIG